MLPLSLLLLCCFRALSSRFLNDQLRLLCFPSFFFAFMWLWTNDHLNFEFEFEFCIWCILFLYMAVHPFLSLRRGLSIRTDPIMVVKSWAPAKETSRSNKICDMNTFLFCRDIKSSSRILFPSVVTNMKSCFHNSINIATDHSCLIDFDWFEKKICWVKCTFWYMKFEPVFISSLEFSKWALFPLTFESNF